MNLLDLKYSNKNKENCQNLGDSKTFTETDNTDNTSITFALEKIKSLIKEKILSNTNTGISNFPPPLQFLDEDLKFILSSLENNYSTRVQSLMSSVYQIKSKVEKLQKENLELIYLKDQQAKLYENEKLNFILLQRREQDYKCELENLYNRLNKFERENEAMREFLDNKNKEESAKKFSQNFENLESDSKNQKIQNNQKIADELNFLKSQNEEIKNTLNLELKRNLENSQLINNLTQINEELQQNFNLLLNAKNSLEEKNFQLIQENKMINDNLTKFSMRYYNYDQQMSMKIKEVEYLNEQLNYKSDKLNDLEKRYENLNIQYENKNNIIDDLTERIKSMKNCSSCLGNISTLASTGNNQYNQANQEDGYTLQKNKINQLTEQNNFLSVRLNNLSSSNNQILKEKEILLLEIQNLKSGNNCITKTLSHLSDKVMDEDCSECKNKIIFMEKNYKSEEIFKKEILELTKEKNELLMLNEKFKLEIQNFHNSQYTNYNHSNSIHQNENLNLKNLLRDKNESLNELTSKFNQLNLHLQEKDNLIQFLDNEKLNLKNEIYEINNKLFKKDQEISSLQKELILMNKDSIINNIQTGEIKEKIIEHDFINKNLNFQIKENSSTNYNLEALNEKLKMILKNKDDIISKQGGEISNLMIKLKENEQKFIQIENDIKNFKEKIQLLEVEKKNMNKLLIKYKLNTGK